MYNDGIRKYQETSVKTIGPERMIVMLYEGIVTRLQEARNAAESNDIATRCRSLTKAQAIVSELNNSLDHGVGGDVAANLASVYDYLTREILEAHLKADVKPIDNALRVIAPLLEAWQTIKPGTADRAKGAPLAGGTEDGPEHATKTMTEDGIVKELCVAV